ncbi:MAG: Gfo/Idh/MocA family oxidoreductase [Spirochaetales bacterium]|nr:Gfo/Idh/MocA family oxidoreductase [Spirochaetales bacterium]
MKVVIVGNSGHKNYVLDAFSPAFSIEGVAPGVEGESMDSLMGDPRIDCPLYADWHALLDRVNPDLVVNNTWYGRAAAVTAESLKRGIHVFAEKPLAGSLEELDEIRRLWRKGSAVLGGMFGISYSAPFVTLREYLKSEGIGRLRMINARKSYKLGERPEFYKHRDTYTGTIPWVGSHGVDWILRYSGKRILEGYALHSTEENCGHGDLELTALCSYLLEDGIQASLSIDYCRPGAASTHGDDRLRMAGTEGVLEIREGRVFLIDSGEEREMPLLPAESVFSSFLQACLSTESGRIWGDHALSVSEICLKSRDAADGCRRFTL